MCLSLRLGLCTENSHVNEFSQRSSLSEPYWQDKGVCDGVSQEKGLSQAWKVPCSTCHCSRVTSELAATPPCHSCLAQCPSRGTAHLTDVHSQGAAHVVSLARDLQMFSLIAGCLLGG